MQCVSALGKSRWGDAIGGRSGGRSVKLQFSQSDVETLEQIHRRKTGALLTVSLELGGINGWREPGKARKPD